MKISKWTRYIEIAKKSLNVIPIELHTVNYNLKSGDKGPHGAVSGLINQNTANSEDAAPCLEKHLNNLETISVLSSPPTVAVLPSDGIPWAVYRSYIT